MAAIGYWGIGLPLGVVLAFHFGFAGGGIWIGPVDRSGGGRRPAALALAAPGRAWPDHTRDSIAP